MPDFLKVIVIYTHNIVALIRMKSTSEKSPISLILALGSNMGDPRNTFKAAFNLISDNIGPILEYSKIYRTKPLNPPELSNSSQPDFINAACLCESYLSEEETLKNILLIETTLGRDRSKEIRWGPRTIDIDLLDYNNNIYSSSNLKIPHPEIQNRDFVLLPLKDVAPNYIHPKLNLSIDQIIIQYKEKNLPDFVCGVIEETLHYPSSK